MQILLRLAKELHNLGKTNKMQQLACKKKLIALNTSPENPETPLHMGSFPFFILIHSHRQLHHPNPRESKHFYPYLMFGTTATQVCLAYFFIVLLLRLAHRVPGQNLGSLGTGPGSVDAATFFQDKNGL